MPLPRKAIALSLGRPRILLGGLAGPGPARAAGRGPDPGRRGRKRRLSAQVQGLRAPRRGGRPDGVADRHGGQQARAGDRLLAQGGGRSRRRRGQDPGREHRGDQEGRRPEVGRGRRGQPQQGTAQAGAGLRLQRGSPEGRGRVRPSPTHPGSKPSTPRSSPTPSSSRPSKRRSSTRSSPRSPASSSRNTSSRAESVRANEPVVNLGNLDRLRVHTYIPVEYAYRVTIGTDIEIQPGWAKAPGPASTRSSRRSSAARSRSSTPRSR